MVLRAATKAKTTSRVAKGHVKRTRKQGMYVNTKLQRPRVPSSKAWPLSKLNFMSMPLEQFGFGSLLDNLLKSRGWKVNRPCTVVTDEDLRKGEPEDVYVYMDEFESCLRGRTKYNKVEKGQSVVCKGPKKLPSHVLMFQNSALTRDDFARMFLANRKKFASKPGTAYSFCAIAGSEAALFKCNISTAFRNEDWYPTAYTLPDELDLLRKDIKASGNSYWIAKPNDDYGGTGITVWSHDDPDFMKLLRETKKRSIVQRYLHDPMLLGPFKFHMRIHLVITSLKPLKAYVHEGGQVLCGTRPYSLSKKLLNRVGFDRAVHLTNQCFNAKPENQDNYLRAKPVIGKGQQVTIPELESYLKKHHKGFDREDLWRQIVHVGQKMAEHIAGWRTVKQHLPKFEGDEMFEVFGMDLMLDKACKVWMCETNNSPGLGYPDKLILGAPNPDYGKEATMCHHVWHDTMALMGLDAGKKQTKGSLKHWYELDFSEKQQ